MPYLNHPWTHGGERLPEPPPEPDWTEEQAEALRALYGAVEDLQQAAGDDQLDALRAIGVVEDIRAAIPAWFRRLDAVIDDAEEYLREEEDR